MSIYEGLSAGEFDNSLKKKLPICICLDVSGSMIAPTNNGSTRIDELNKAFIKFIDSMKSNKDVASSADIAIVTFGGKVDVIQPFAPIENIQAPLIEVNERSFTPMGEAIQVGLKLLELRKEGYKNLKGTKYYQPWLVIITDGEPEGENAIENIVAATAQLNELEKENKLVVYNIGIGEDADMETLKKLSIKNEKPISISETNLDELFSFLKASSETAIRGEETTGFYEKDSMPKGKEIDISKWRID